MKQQLQELIRQAVDKLELPVIGLSGIKIEKTRDPEHGDFAANIALILAGQTGDKPRELAARIVQHIPVSGLVRKIEIAGPGFINFFLIQDAHLDVIRTIIRQGKHYGCSDYGQGQSILIEFVSANPTGPLHIGHGRGAAYGAATANLLTAIGYKVDREYYINDAGRQMDILACSVYLRYLQQCDVPLQLPENAYQGEYIQTIAAKMFASKGKTLLIDTQKLETIITDDGDGEKQLDNIIHYIKQNLGEKNYLCVFDTGLNEILADIRKDLEEFGVVFDYWYSERSLLAGDSVKQCMEVLEQNGHLYKRDGATWFKSTACGDEKDRVVIRDNGQLTYFATDIAYHKAKFDRGYARAIDIWGADHHGYIPRVKAALTALGLSADKLDVLLVQFATLYRGDVKVQMSTRSGQFVTLRELREEVGCDAARFFYVMRKSEQHLDFDLELAKSQSQNNPVYYIQYAHARICSVFRQLNEKGWSYTPDTNKTELSRLQEPYESALLNRLGSYPDILLNAGRDCEPHQIGYYLRDLANEFHAYYNACQLLVEDAALRDARLCLIYAVRQVLQNGLELLGVSAPESM